MKRRSRILMLTAVAVALMLGGFCLYPRGLSAKQLLEAPLPSDARVLHIASRAGMFGGDYYTVIEMSERIFARLSLRSA